MKTDQTYSHLQEKDILVLVRNGEQQAIDYLYRSNFSMIKSLVKNINERVVPEDIYQEAFMVFLNKVYEQDLSCKISTFLYSVARNLSLKELRHVKRYATDSEHEVVDIVSDVEDYDEEQLKRQKLKACLTKLGDKCRQIIERFYLQSQSMEEIADSLNYTNAANAKNQKYKCMKQLKALMNG